MKESHKYKQGTEIATSLAHRKTSGQASREDRERSSSGRNAMTKAKWLERK
jgi:hypothetical protein